MAEKGFLEEGQQERSFYFWRKSDEVHDFFYGQQWRPNEDALLKILRGNQGLRMRVSESYVDDEVPAECLKNLGDVAVEDLVSYLDGQEDVLFEVIQDDKSLWEELKQAQVDWQAGSTDPHYVVLAYRITDSLGREAWTAVQWNYNELIGVTVHDDYNVLRRYFLGLGTIQE